jgi:hypothetical protein
MCKPDPFKFAHGVSVKPTTRRVPIRPRRPGSIVPTRKLGIVRVNRTSPHRPRNRNPS